MASGKRIPGTWLGRCSAGGVDLVSRTLDVSRDGPDVRLILAGRWTLADGVPPLTPLSEQMGAIAFRRLSFDTRGVTAWDTALVAFAFAVAQWADRRKVELHLEGLPPTARKLLVLARVVPPAGAVAAAVDDALTARVGRIGLRAWSTAGDALEFLGETVLALLALLRGRARFRRVDMLHALEATGVAALGIVALVNFLIGTVLAFVGAVQLQAFGAAIYVANLVAIGVTRELAPIMTGIVMTGRTGAAFAALLGTMTVNEEVDALVTMGLRPVETLVLPRVLATALMLPALVAYADVLGMLGGLVVGVTMLHLSPVEYLRQAQDALALRQVWIGLGKAVAFGAVVALTGCYYGLRCGRSAAAVGEATTRAVVMGIVLVVVVDAIATVLLHALGL
jgi:phospholipid/cholesterol/gamma-HCH transport system permease protein